MRRAAHFAIMVWFGNGLDMPVRMCQRNSKRPGEVCIVMKIGYGNYGMPDTPYEQVIRQVRDIGYDGLELSVGASYPTSPDRLHAEDRKKMRSLMEDVGLEII